MPPDFEPLLQVVAMVVVLGSDSKFGQSAQKISAIWHP